MSFTVKSLPLAPLVVSMSLVAVACSDGAGPGSGPPGISVVSQGPPSDTIGAVHPLIIEVRRPIGRPARNMVVAFQGSLFDVRISVGTAGTQVYRASVSDTTDQSGRATVDVQLGDQAGTARIVVTVAELELADTVFYEIRPGAPFRIIVAPEDTAVYVGRTFTSRPRVVDRGGNPLGNPVAYSSASPSLEASADGVISGVSAGRGAYLARFGTVVDTGWVSVIPVTGTIAVSRPPRHVGDGFAVAILGLDGSGFRVLAEHPYTEASYPGGAGLPPRWHPGGTRLFYHTGYPLVPKRLYTVGLTDAPRLLTGSSSHEEWADVSRDGTWVYYVVSQGTDPATIWRVRPDGTSPQAVAPAQPRTPDLFPAISPDGASLAYTAYGPPRVRVRDLATGVRTALDVAGKAPRWSPSGDLIAYIGGEFGGLIRVVRPDGTGDRAVSSIPYDGTLTWSPDGRYVIAQSISTGLGVRADYRGALELVEVSTGERIILPFPTLSYPDWMPGSSSP